MNIEITKLSHDGRGVARDNAGKTIFIDGVLPGETVSYTVTRSKRRFNEGVATDILNPSQQRVTPKCAHFLTCGGCAQQHISSEAQIETKQQTLLEQLEHFGQVKPVNILPPLTGPIWGYRNKARLGVRYVIKKEKVLVGFRERYKNYLAELDQCEVLHPKIGLLITPLRDLIRSLAAYQEIAQVEVAIGDDRMALVFRNMVPLTPDDEQLLIAFATQHDCDIYLQPGKPESIFKLWPQDGIERLYYSLPAYNLNLGFYPLDFTQINPELNRKMIAQAISLMQLNADDHVLDLFCGLGNFTLAMATIAASVVGVEGSATMVERGYENAQRNNLTNVNFYAADLTTDQHSAVWAKQRYTKVLIDPPRTGAAEILPLLAGLGVDMILYVSCNPATLARDSGILTQQYGYKLQHVGVMDMFAHTLHVEAMALFVR
jgi:23S rRNA (uracil1939-C5)-methyltransferase